MSRISLRVGFSAAGSVSSASFALFLKNIGLIPVGHDLSSRVLDNRHLSRYLSSPPVTKHEAYKDFLRSFILNHCDLYLPFLDSELQVCFELKKESELFSTRIPLSDSSTIQACDDKLHLKELLSSCGINCIPQPDCVPVVVKPRRGSGGKEILIIRDPVLFPHIQSTFQNSDYMLEAYLPGILISTDVLWDIEGRVDTIFSRIRSNGGGVSTASKPVTNQVLLDTIYKAVQKLGSIIPFSGLISVQFIAFNDNLYLLEINCRPGGSISHSHMLGSQIFTNFLAQYLSYRTPSTSSSPAFRHISRFFYDECI